MATISGIRGWGFLQAQSREAPQEVVAKRQNPNRLRAMPNEDLYLYKKRIDNSRVVRQADPEARGRCWSAIGAACVLTVALVSMLAPSVATILAGYQVQSLKGEQQRLLDERRRLEVEEATLVSPARLEQLARQRSMQQPSAGQIVHMDGAPNASVALNTVK